MSEPRPLHRLFGLTWMDFFDGTDVTVEVELDLSVKQQFLDLVLIRTGNQPIPWPLPDGFEVLASHNLITFKSYQESLDCWTMWELIGHFVNYRKQTSQSLQNLLPENDFLLFAVCARFPANLAQRSPLTPVKAGVYEVEGFGLRVRVIVVSELPLQEHNAMLHLFSAREELLRYGQEHYHLHSKETSTLLYQLFRVYGEDTTMSEKLKEFVRQSIDEMLRNLPIKERLKGVSNEDLRNALPVEERLKGVPNEERLKGVPNEERLKGVPAEERLKDLPLDELLRAIPPEALEALKRQIKASESSNKPA